MERSATLRREEVLIPAGAVTLAGELSVPAGADGMVVFAHGSGSSRFSPRNLFVAEVLQNHGLATLLIDLLTPREEQIDERTTEYRFDIELLTGRVVAAVDWLQRRPDVHGLRTGLFGASTGAAAALMAAAQRPEAVAAVVSRGGRPDLARELLPRVTAPTLLIVGGLDYTVITMNRTAQSELRSENRLEIIPGATHLFEESGALEEVARLAAEWFTNHLSGGGARLAS